MNYLIEYQRKAGLVPDGAFGVKTANALIEEFKINELILTFKTPPLIACCHFVGQIKHESMGFTAARELIGEKTANTNYANHHGNGNYDSGDGYKYRGGGGIQTTFKDNYEAYFKYAGLPLDTDPNIMLEPVHWWGSAAFFFEENGLWRYARDRSDKSVLAVSRAINCGDAYSRRTPNGLAYRIKYTNDFFKACGA